MATIMTISLRSPREMKDVLDHYTATQDDYGFAKTSVLVNLARTGREQLISRSQARRLLARFEQFRELTLDFTGVDLIGPAFADEIFRVFTGQKPWLSRDVGECQCVSRTHDQEGARRSGGWGSGEAAVRVDC